MKERDADSKTRDPSRLLVFFLLTYIVRILTSYYVVNFSLQILSVFSFYYGTF